MTNHNPRARQTAIAAENINYRKSEQTEAYVTAVLLQVAEIIVSESNISEILDKIISIMPILIGVECALFLLWDKSREVFIIEKKFSGKWKENILGFCWSVLMAVEEIAVERNKSVSQIALGWLLSQEVITSPIIGPRTLNQLKDNLGAIGLRLNLDEVHNLNLASKTT